MNPKNISVIVQGAISKNETSKCLNSIRQYLPGAEIILSTWEGSEVTKLDYDVLVMSRDPGSFACEKTGKFPNNMNRQLLSTKEGLKYAHREYIMKLRADLILTSGKFLTHFTRYPARCDDYMLFKQKILTSMLVSRFDLNLKNKSLVPIPFHPSDWWFFGLNEDIKTYFDTELPKEPEFSSYFLQAENLDKKSPFRNCYFKFCPEQYFCYACFSKHFPEIEMEDCSDITEDIVRQSRMILVNNFIMLNFKDSGIFTNKYLYSKNELFAGEEYLNMYNKDRYEFEYKKYCEPNFVLSQDNIYSNGNSVSLRKKLLRLYKHIFGLMDTQVSFRKKLENLFIGIPVAAVYLLPEVLALLKKIKTNKANIFSKNL